MSQTNTHAFVLGPGGFLGQIILAEAGARYTPLRVSQVQDENDLMRFEREVENVLKHNPQAAIVNCIGRREASLDLMKVLNVGIPEILVKVTKRFEARLIHFGSAAETTQSVQKASEGIHPAPAATLTYGTTKRAGTDVCLTYEKATVLRVYNLHGLPHQSSSGLHQLCRSVRIALDRGTQPSLIDTTRDYVHWQAVLNALNNALDFNSNGLIEVCSGFGIAMSEIIEGLPLDVRTQVAEQLKPPDYFAPVIGPHPTLGEDATNKSNVVRALSDEVTTCASSG